MKNNKPNKIAVIISKIFSISFFIAALVLLINSILLFLFLKADSFLYRRELRDYDAGKVAERTIVAEYEFQYVDKKSTSNRDYELERNITPIFKVYKEITDEALISFDNFVKTFKESLLDKRGQIDLDTVFTEKFSRYPGLNEPLIARLYEKPSAVSILEISKEILESVMFQGIITSDNSKGESGGYPPDSMFEMWRWEDKSRREKEEMTFSSALTKEKVKSYAMKLAGKIEEVDKNIIAELVFIFSKENCFYDFEETQQKRERVLTNAAPVYKTIKKEDIIVKKGFVITDTDMEIINAMGGAGIQTNYRQIIAVLMYVLSLFYLAYILFTLPIEKTLTAEKGNNLLILVMAEVFFMFILIVFKLTDLPSWFNYAILTLLPLFTMTISLVISQTSGVFFSIVMSCLVLIVGNFSPFAFLFSFFSGISGVYCVQKTESRIDLIIAGVKTGFFNAFFAVMLLFFTNFDFTAFIVSAGSAFLNGFMSGILVLGVLPIVEHILNSPTRFRLIELSDLNSPILKKMHTRAPGTFNHSLSVANLAETACREIGANPLLARVGAYYHDIGKIDQAKFFIENQQAFNIHDELTPDKSASIIKSHVKIGIEKAKEIGLPVPVIDIIAQHHGNGLISFFYVHALKLESKAKINPKDYSYTEGKPKSKEAAVVLLADNVEAAARTLQTPTVAKLDEFIWQIIFSKIESDQITESDLTFKDLKIIKDSFLKTLTGSYHSRIEYPDVKESEAEAAKK